MVLCSQLRACIHLIIGVNELETLGKLVNSLLIFHIFRFNYGEL